MILDLGKAGESSSTDPGQTGADVNVDGGFGIEKGPLA
jgi:hypothetical protein